MTFDNITTAPCLLPPVVQDSTDSTNDCPDTGEDARCADPEWAADNPTLCLNAPTITGLRVAVEDGVVAVGSYYQFFAYLLFSDGREKDVTALASWSTSNGALASVAFGKVLGVAVGELSVVASYRDKVDYSALEVEAACVQAGLELVLVFDRSASMLETDAAGRTRADAAKQAAFAILDNCLFEKDFVSVVSFGGAWEESTDHVIVRRADASLHLTLSREPYEIAAAISTWNVPTDCLYTPTGGGQGTRCATGIGGGLELARQELTSARHDSTRRRVVVLFTSGVDDICSPDPVTVANALKALDATIIVIGAQIPNSSVSVCGASAGDAWDWLTALASCDLFFPGDEQAEYADAYARIHKTICDLQGDVCLPTIAPPDPEPTVPAEGHRDKLDYTGWTNWNVIGFVDLIGLDLIRLLPGNDQYVDLVGTDKLHKTGKNALGTFYTKREFSIASQRYRLTFKLAGNQRCPLSGYQVQVAIGSLTATGEVVSTVLNETITVDNWIQPFTEYVFDFSASDADSVGHLIFKHLALPSGAIPTAGILLESVQLDNLDTGETLFTDDFSAENP